jgi:hypothetical protein
VEGQRGCGEGEGGQRVDAGVALLSARCEITGRSAAAFGHQISSTPVILLLQQDHI